MVKEFYLIMQFKTKNYKLRLVNIKMVNENYLSWFKDKKVNNYIDSRPKNINQLKYEVSKMINQKKTIFWGIFKENKHIGNIKIFEINYKNNFARLGILIGDKNYRNKGCGKEIIKAVLLFLLKKKINKVWLGVGKKNLAAIKAYKKCNFVKYKYDEKYLNIRLKKNNIKYNQKHIFMLSKILK